MPPHSPILFWLLLPATLAVDAVAVMFLWDTKASDLAYTLYWALTFGQLSVICVRIVLWRAKVGMTWLIAFLAGLPFALVLALISYWQDLVPPDEVLVAVMGLIWTHVAAVLVTLWMLKPTRLSTRIANVAAQPPWQFAVRHLLIVTTCLALLAFMLSHNDPLHDAIADVASIVIANVALLIGVVIALRLGSPLPLRLALTLAIAIGIAIVSNRIGAAFATDMNLYALFVVQAIVIWAWLELYRPTEDDTARAETVSLAPESLS
jgi:hypothetical protein